MSVFRPFTLVLLTILMTALLGCGQGSNDSAVSTPGVGETTNAADYQTTLREQLISAKSGDVIDIPAGTHNMARGLSLNASGVTIRGAGMDKSILSFKDQVQGAEGLLINGNDIVLEGFAVEDAKGDAIKVNEGKNLIIRKVRTEWTNGISTDNGAYGIYPVQMENVLIEDSVAIAASDAGIYVGQSKEIVVRRNRVEYNVAGIEIENSFNADVYENVASNNTGGILVFNMPNMPQPGHSTRVYNNEVANNNTKNFGAKGTPVASVPAGSGIVINSNDKVEIFNNNLVDNKTAHVLITSYFTAGFFSDKSTQEDFDPYPESIYIYDNKYSGGGDSPGEIRLKALRIAKFGLQGRLPNILWDGITNESSRGADGKLKPALAICIDKASGDLLNLDAANDFDKPEVTTNDHLCALEKLKAVSIPQA